MRKRETANFREQTCAVPSVMAGLHEHPGQERGAYGRSEAATAGLPKPAGQRAHRRAPHTKAVLPCWPGFRDRTGRRAAALPKTGTQRGKYLSPVPCPAERDAWATVRACSAPPHPLDRPCRRRKERQAGRTPDSGQKKDDRLPRGRSSRPKREDVLMVRGYGEGGGCSREPRQDQGGLPCRICCPPKAGRDDLRSKIRRSQEGPAGARGIPGRGRSSRGLHFVERELRLKVPVKGGCCFREPGRKEEELPARYFFLPLAGISS